eukprot:1306062-Pyramimonas_sp.AAC.1
MRRYTEASEHNPQCPKLRKRVLKANTSCIRARTAWRRHRTSPTGRPWRAQRARTRVLAPSTTPPSAWR